MHTYTYYTPPTHTTPPPTHTNLHRWLVIAVREVLSPRQPASTWRNGWLSNHWSSIMYVLASNSLYCSQLYKMKFFIVLKWKCLSYSPIPRPLILLCLVWEWECGREHVFWVFQVHHWVSESCRKDPPLRVGLMCRALCFFDTSNLDSILNECCGLRSDCLRSHAVELLAKHGLIPSPWFCQIAKLQ